MSADELARAIAQAIEACGFYIGSYSYLSTIRKILIDYGVAHLMQLIPISKHYFVLEPNTKQCNLDCKANCIDRKGEVSNDCYYKCLDKCIRQRIEKVIKRLSEVK